jgi:hypothetical protein
MEDVAVASIEYRRVLGDVDEREEWSRKVVRPRRFELLTYSFGGCRSIQLSYGRAPLA